LKKLSIDKCGLSREYGIGGQEKMRSKSPVKGGGI
jgi:hypothetical protein